MPIVSRMTIEKATQEIANGFEKLSEEVLNLIINAVATKGSINDNVILTKILDKLTKGQKKLFPIIEEYIRYHYVNSQLEVVKEMKKAGLLVDEKLSEQQMLELNAIVSDTLNGYGETLRGAFNSSQKVMTEARKLRLEKLFLAGNLNQISLQELKKQIRDDLAMDITSIVDKSGKNWKLSTYAEMLARTRLREVTNTGLTTRLQMEGFDLVQVSQNNSSHFECRQWEGRILSLTGKTKGYPTTREAESSGLMHPNCKHRYLPAPIELRLKELENNSRML